MSILPDFLLSLVTGYLTPLLHWFSQRVYADLLKRAPDHLLLRLHGHLDFAPLERACAPFHHISGPGAPPTHLVPRLVRALLVKYLFDWSLRELEFHLRFHLLVKWFVGYAVFDLGPDHATLERFEQWVGVHQPRLFFDTVLRQIDRDFPELRTRPQVGDTFALRADAARESLVTLLRHTCRRLLAEFRRVAPDRHQRLLAQLPSTALFGSPDEVDEVFLSVSQRQARLQAVVTAALHCARLVRAELDTAPPLDAAQRAEPLYWLGHLDKILADEVALTFDPEDPPRAAELADCLDDQNALLMEITDALPAEARAPLEVLELARADKGAYRLGSATDPDATYRVHGPDKTDFGFNAQVATDGVFVREIQVATGAQPDAVGIPAVLVAQHQHHGFYPAKFIYDTAAGSGKTRALVEQATDGQTQLVAPLLPYDKRTARFGPECFTLSPDGSSLTCPSGQTSEVAYPHGRGEGRSFRFFHFQCKDCLLWNDCRGENSGPRSMRQVFISDYRPHADAARAYNQTPEFKQDMKLRPAVERIIAGLVRYNGARRARRRGRGWADFQARMCATAFNLKTWVRRLLKRDAALAVGPA